MNIETRATSISQDSISNIVFITVHGHNEGHIACYFKINQI